MSDRPDSTRPAQLPEPPEIAEPEPPDVALRRTFAVQLAPDAAAALETACSQAVEAARESHGIHVGFLDWIAGAAADLDSLAGFLDLYADNCGEGLTREDVPLGAAVLEILPAVEGAAQRLREAVAAARAAS